jgi:N-acetylmuramoyl-L-alanine amidase CwlA
MEIKKLLVDESKYNIKCPYEMNAEFIVVHNTANDAAAENEIKYMIGNDKKVSFHYAVDDKEIVQGIPINRNTYNAGDGRNGDGNRKGIAIEICYSKSGGDKFIQAEKNAAKFIASILKEKGWGIDKVKKHSDFSKKYCPHRTLDMGWDRFLNMVKEHLYETTATKSIDQLAQEVIDGKHGVGQARKNALGSLYSAVQAVVNRLLTGKATKPSTPKYTYLSNPNYKGDSIVDALRQIGVDSSFENRKKLASKNNIKDYTGRASENKRMLDRLKAGKLIK